MTVLNALMEKEDNMHEWMDNVNREMETLKKNQKEVTKVKSIVT